MELSTTDKSRVDLVDFKAIGITHVRLLRSGLRGKSCHAAVQQSKRTIPLAQACVLPLAGCTKKECNCLWTAQEDPAES